MPSSEFVSRGGVKLAAALDYFELNPAGSVCADLGSHVGGFVDCLLQRGAARVYSVDTAYGTLAWTLRRDSRVVTVERTSAMHVTLPEPVDLVTVDVGWTPQAKVLPNAARLLKHHTPAAAAVTDTDRPVQPAKPTGPFGPGTPHVLTLVKPHYEASRTIEGPRAEPASNDGRPQAGKRRSRRDSVRSTRTPPPPSLLVDGVLPDDKVEQVVQAVLGEIVAMGWTVLGTFPSPIRGHAGNREVFALLTRT